MGRLVAVGGNRSESPTHLLRARQWRRFKLRLGRKPQGWIGSNGNSGREPDGITRHRVSVPQAVQGSEPHAVSAPIEWSAHGRDLDHDRQENIDIESHGHLRQHEQTNREGVRKGPRRLKTLAERSVTRTEVFGTDDVERVVPADSRCGAWPMPGSISVRHGPASRRCDRVNLGLRSVLIFSALNNKHRRSDTGEKGFDVPVAKVR